MQDAQNPEGLPDYSKGVSTGFDRVAKSLDLGQKREFSQIHSADRTCETARQKSSG